MLVLCKLCVRLLWITLWITFLKSQKKRINKGLFQCVAIVDNFPQKHKGKTQKHKQIKKGKKKNKPCIGGKNAKNK